jgi:hypothetical protein
MIEIFDIYWHIIEMLESCANPVNSQFWLKIIWPILFKNCLANFGLKIVWPILGKNYFGQKLTQFW